jgi:hypothetical protein
MKTIIALSGAWIIISLFSCQKQLSLPDTPATDSLPADTLPAFKVTDIIIYNYDTAGILVADSEHIRFTYDTVALSTTMTGEYRDAVNGSFNYKHVFFYDANNNWLRDEVYDPSNFSLMEQSNVFTRNAAGDAQRFDYSKEDYSGNPRPFSAIFQYRGLSNGNRETTVVDTGYADYSRFSYYKVELSNAGKLMKREILPWSQYAEHNAAYYSYDATGQVQKVVDSSTYFPPSNPPAMTIITSNYIQDPIANNTLDVFTKSAKGKKFWWYMQGKSYVYNLLYDGYYVGMPLKAINSTTQVYQNGALLSTTQNNYVYNNLFDQDNNLAGFLCTRNGKRLNSYIFEYVRIK